jgi:hypothetical protein
MPWRSPSSSPAPSFMGHSSSPRASAIRPAAHSVRLFLPCMNHTICGWCTPAAAASRRWLRPRGWLAVTPQDGVIQRHEHLSLQGCRLAFAALLLYGHTSTSLPGREVISL